MPVSFTDSFLDPALVIVNLPEPSLSVLGDLPLPFLRSGTLAAWTTTVSGAVRVIVIVHGNAAQVTSTVTVEPVLVAPPPTVAGVIASAAWNDCANTEPLSSHDTQPCPAELTELSTEPSPPSLSALSAAVAQAAPPSAL